MVDRNRITVQEAARRLGVHVNTVRKYVDNGILDDGRLPGTSFLKLWEGQVEELAAGKGVESRDARNTILTANPEYVNASQLSQWPDVRPRDAQAMFPKLIRELLMEHPGSTAVSVRVGDGVALPGWDGTATLVTPNAILPAGDCVFEFGVGQDPRDKANHDFNNRKGFADNDKTYVFATPRRWPGKEKWAEQRRAEGLYHNVIALDADDLEAWLKCSPISHVWISKHLGLAPKNAQTLSDWWRKFSTSTQPPLPKALFLAGRDAQANDLQRFLAGPPRLVTIRGDWKDDIFGFIAAALDSERTLVIDATEVWNRVIALDGAGVLIPNFNGADIDQAIENGWHVIDVRDATVSQRRRADITLDRVTRDGARDAFLSVGLELYQADNYARIARRGLPSLVLYMSKTSRGVHPSWALPPGSLKNAGLVLAGKWTDSEADLAALAEIVGITPDEVSNLVVDNCHGTHPLVWCASDNTWTITVPEMAFLELASQITRPMAERWASVITNPHNLISTTLRQGLATALALVGSLSGEGNAPDFLEEITVHTVRRLLTEPADEPDCGFSPWKRFAEELPLFAEAAPIVFLDCLELDLESKNPKVAELFAFELQQYLLHALERLAWNSEYLIQIVQLLVKLSILTVPGARSEMPLDTLARILEGRWRNTNANLDLKFQAIDTVWRQNPELAWRLLELLWPGHRGLELVPEGPQFRDWKVNTEQHMGGEWYQFVEKLADRAIRWSQNDIGKLPWLIDALTNVGASSADRIIGHVEVAANSIAHDDARIALSSKITETVNRHREFSTAQWALPVDQLERLEGIRKTLQIADDPRNQICLFSWHPPLPGISDGNFAKYEVARDSLRLSAIHSALANPDGWGILAEMAEKCKVPETLGSSIAMIEGDFLSPMLHWFGSSSENLRTAAVAWARKKFEISGADLTVAVLDHPDAVEEVITRFLPTIPTGSTFWGVLRAYPERLRKYWEIVPIESVPDADVPEAVNSLLAANRAWAAISVLANSVNYKRTEPTIIEVDQVLVTRALTDALSQEPTEFERIHADYHIAGLLDYLASSDATQETLANFEFAFIGVLNHYREPKALNGILATEPERFVELVRHAYIGAKKPGPKPKNQTWLAQQAYLALSKWQGLPGLQPDGSVDEDLLSEWVKQSRYLLSQSGHESVGDRKIGRVLAFAPTDDDGTWPPAYVRDLIEMVGSRDIEDGIMLACLNKQGETVRGQNTGGDQEVDLAKQYREWARQAQLNWPRTARTLRTVADNFTRLAKGFDQQANAYQDL